MRSHERAEENMSIQHPSTNETVNITAHELFATELPKVLKARKEIAQSIGAVCVFQVDGKQWTIDLKKAKVTSGNYDRPDMRLEMTEADFQGLISGKLDAVEALRTRRLGFYGNPNVLVGFAALIRMSGVN
jgi:putative sterol carrier protein